MARNKACNKKEIIDVAFNLIKNEGIEAFTARSLAKELQVSSMTIYNYVKNIDEVKKEVIIKGFNILYKNIFEDIKSNQPYLKTNKLKKICEIMGKNMHDFAIEYRGVYQLMYNTSNLNIKKDPEVQPFYGLYTKLIYRFKFENIEMEEIKRCFYLYELIVRGLIKEKVFDKSAMTDEEFNQHIDCALDRLFGNQV